MFQLTGIPRTKRFVVEPEVPVAFHAVVDLRTIEHIGVHQHIVFEEEYLNVGEGYHKLLGTFLAPYDGIYVFSASVMSSVNDHPEVQAAIVKNGTVLARIFGHGDNGRHDQGSATVTIQLNTGDEVWVVLSDIPH